METRAVGVLGDGVVAEADLLGSGDLPTSDVDFALELSPADRRRLEGIDEVLDDLACADAAAGEAARAMARRLQAVADLLTGARQHPELWLDDAVNPHSREGVDYACRAAVAQLATTLGVSEVTIHGCAATAGTLRSRLPRIWASLKTGEVSFAKARILADAADTLPDEPGLWHRFEDEAIEVAGTLTPAKLRNKARGLRETLHPEPATDRHAEAVKDRRVWWKPELDGMATLGAYLPADTVMKALAHLDTAAGTLAGADEETRALTQLRADVAGDLLTGDSNPVPTVRASVNVTVPVLTLLNADDNHGRPAVDNSGAADVRTADSFHLPAASGGVPILDGYGPIDDDTARRLAADAPSFHRILTHPISGTVLDVDRTVYRPPAHLRRYVQTRYTTCAFPGCGRPASSSDLDHIHDWAKRGKTAADNLVPLCRHHHRMKHLTRWSMTRDTDGTIHWTSPTGTRHNNDPPPF